MAPIPIPRAAEENMRPEPPARGFDDLVRATAHWLDRRESLQVPPLLLASVSGGADSVFLGHLLHAVARVRVVSLHIMHFNHGLRPEAAEDARFVRALCERWRAPCHVHTFTPEQIRETQIANLQAALRHLRYRLLTRTALSLASPSQTPILVTGHQADDQAETLLLNLARGTGLPGLQGIRPWQTLRAAQLDAQDRSHRTVHLFRPLLAVERTRIQATLRHFNLAWREDPSNRNPRFARNRIRHEVIPAMQALNPRFIANLARNAQAWSPALDDLRSMHDAELARLELKGLSGAPDVPPARIVWRLDEFRALPTWKRHGLLYAVARRLQHERETSAARIDDLAARLGAVKTSGGPWPWFGRLSWSVWHRPRAALHGLPSTASFLVSVHHQEALPFRFDHPLLSAATMDGVRIDLDADLEASARQIEFGPWTLCLRASAPPSESDLGPWYARLDRDRLERAGSSVRIGPAAPGLKMQPAGMHGRHKKLRHLLRDRRVHPSLQPYWPTLYAADGRVAWVCGLHVDERFGSDPARHRVLEVRWQPGSRRNGSRT